MTADSPRLVLVFACIGHGLFHVLVALFLTIVLVLEPVWNRSYDELIGLWTGGALLVGLGAPIAGWLSDRWGESRVMIIFFIGIGIATVLCGMAESPGILAVTLGLVGLFGAIYHPVGTAWVMKNAQARGKAISIVGICGGVGAAAASLVAGLLTDLIDWRAAFMLPGVFSIVIGIVLWWSLATGRIVERSTDIAPQQEPSQSDVRQAFVVLGITMSLTTIVYYAFTTMLPKWLDGAVGHSLGDGLVGLGALVSFVYLIGTFAQLVGGHYSDRGSAKQIYVVSYGLKLAALLLALAVGGWLVVFAAVVIIFMFDIAAPVENVLIARFTSNRRRGLAYGIRNGIAIIAGPLGIQLVSWLFDDATGFSSLLLVLCGIVAVIFAAALMLPTDQPKAVPAAGPMA